jgi:hypothetical protein
MANNHKEAPQSVVIANPIYDTVFRYLMENERVAKFFIGTLLEQNVVSVDFKSKTLNKVKGKKRKTASENREESPIVQVLQMDFVATICTETGEHKKILIEMQKSNNMTDVMRFREYLAGQYAKRDIVNNVQEPLPITTIYILGFSLPEVETACVKVERGYKDLIKGHP